MAKSRRRKSRSKRRKQEAKYLPWIVGAIVLAVVFGILWNRAFFGLFARKIEARGFEALAGTTGTSYDGGETTRAYPDPSGSGGRRKLLPALGDEDAPVVVMEFSDIYCGHCKTYNQTSLEGIIQDYVATGKVRYVDHYFGFAQAVSDGTVLAEMCAAEQGKYFEFKHVLFGTVSTAGVNIDKAVREAELDVRVFNTCRRSEKYKPAMEEIVFIDNRGVGVTPTFFINDQKVEGNRPEEIRRLIDAALAVVE